MKVLSNASTAITVEPRLSGPLKELYLRRIQPTCTGKSSVTEREITLPTRKNNWFCNNTHVVSASLSVKMKFFTKQCTRCSNLPYIEAPTGVQIIEVLLYVLFSYVIYAWCIFTCRSLLTITVKKRGTKRNISDVLASSLSGSGSKVCATRPSVPCEQVHVNSIRDLSTVRRFNQEDVFIDKGKVLGKGVFGKCYLGSVGPQSACIKVLRKGPDFEASFTNEAYILSQCCHPNIPLLFGIMTTSGGYNCLLLSFHGIDGVSYSLHALLNKEKERSFMSFGVEWKKVVLGIAKGLKYLHNHQKEAILHNDLKNDNVVVDKTFDAIEPRIIDFGKACFETNARLYHLSKSDKEVYRKRHPQVAPDVRDGICRQSTASDIYSFGRILSSINEENLSIPVLQSMSDMCLDYDGAKRPSTNDLYTFLENLLVS